MYIKKIVWSTDSDKKSVEMFGCAGRPHSPIIGQIISDRSVFTPGKVYKRLYLPATLAEFQAFIRATQNGGDVLRVTDTVEWDDNRGAYIHQFVARPNRHQRKRPEFMAVVPELMKNWGC